MTKFALKPWEIAQIEQRLKDSSNCRRGIILRRHSDALVNLGDVYTSEPYLDVLFIDKSGITSGSGVLRRYDFTISSEIPDIATQLKTKELEIEYRLKRKDPRHIPLYASRYMLGLKKLDTLQLRDCDRDDIVQGLNIQKIQLGRLTYYSPYPNNIDWKSSRWALSDSPKSSLACIYKLWNENHRIHTVLHPEDSMIVDVLEYNVVVCYALDDISIKDTMPIQLKRKSKVR